jgi:hypothetical protein
MNLNDADMGMSGPVVTGPSDTPANSVIVLDKQGQGYVLPASSLGGYSTPDCGGACEFFGSMTSPIYSNPSPTQCYGGGEGTDVNSEPLCHSVSSQIWWDGTLLIWPRYEDVDWCYYTTGASFTCAPSQASNSTYSPSGFPGGSMSLSANSSNTINDYTFLWAILVPTGAPSFTDPGTDTAQFAGAARAYQLVTAPTSSGFSMNQTWSTEDLVDFNGFTTSVFALPTVVNGYLYVPTYDQGVLVFYPNSGS